jgi:hypothetical protein
VDAEATKKLIVSIQESKRSSLRASLVRKGHLDDTPIEITEEDNLTGEDWATLLGGATLKVFKKDQVIVKENEPSHKICQIASGSCTVLKGNTVLGKMSRGEIFGGTSDIEIILEMKEQLCCQWRYARTIIREYWRPMSTL